MIAGLCRVRRYSDQKGGELNRGFVYILVLALAGTDRTQSRPEALEGNSCYTESIEAQRGTSFAVKVYVNNVDTLVGMQVPIYYRSGDLNLSCDSVTFDESRCHGFSLRFFKIEPDEKIVFFAVLNISDPDKGTPVLYAGDGPVARLWFTVPEDSHPGKVVLESGPDAYFPDDQINYGYLFWTPAGIQVKCRYLPGNITLK